MTGAESVDKPRLAGTMNEISVVPSFDKAPVELKKWAYKFKVGDLYRLTSGNKSKLYICVDDHRQRPKKG